VKKRDKQIMPEVLPDPTRNLGPGGPRQRTMKHMNRLLAVTAAGAAIGACSKTQQNQPTSGASTIEVPAPPAESAGSKEDDTPPPRADRDAAIEPGTGTGTEPIPEPTGYGVVDPMPPPARCAGLAQTVKAKTKWKSKTVLELRLAKPSMAGAEFVASEAPTISGGTLKKKTITKTSVVLEIEVSPNASVYAYVAATCAQGPQHIGVSISGPNGTLAQGTTPLVGLNDSW
jgi:hypothetical protein